MRAIRTGILGIAAIAAATGSTAAERPDLRVAVTSIAVHLDPANLGRNVNTRFTENVFETLLVYDHKDGTFHPGLATAWSMISPTVMELKLREGVTCHNGEAFTAEDVAIMLGPMRVLDPKAPGYNFAKKQFLTTLKSVEAVDERTVRITTEIPDPLLAMRLAVEVASIPCADAFRAAQNWEQWGMAPVGTGPYRVAEIRPGDYHRFEAFDGYWGPKAPLASFSFKVVPETGARVAGLLAGEFDIITEIAPDQFETITASKRASIAGGPINNIRVLFYDRNHPALADVRVRQAMNLAIDRELLVETMFHGRTAVPKGLQMASFGAMYVDEHQPAGYDPEKARALIKAAGYDGREIEYRYMQDYYAAEVTTAQVLQQMWKDVGLNVRLVLRENWNQIIAPEVAAGRGINNYSSTANFPDPTSQLWRTYGAGGPAQQNGFGSNARFNELGEKPLYSTDTAVRRAAFAEMLQIFEQDPPGTYLHDLPAFYGVAANVTWDAGQRIFMDFRDGKIAVRR